MSKAWVMAWIALLPAGVGHAGVQLPPEGAELNRRYVEFRWDDFVPALLPHQSVGYRLEIVPDSGRRDPFDGVAFEAYAVSGDEPRTVVREGLSWGTSYAWRVRRTIRPGGGDERSEIHRFAIDPRDPYVPEPVLNASVPDALEPGLTCWTQRRNGLIPQWAYLVCVDGRGEIVLQHGRSGLTFNDMRMLDDGRILYIVVGPDELGQQCRRAEVVTLDGEVVWSSPTDHCGAPFEYPATGTHHEVFPMPIDAPRGANFLLLEFENRRIDLTDVHNGVMYFDRYFRGDAVREYDRHTGEVVREWTTFDSVCIDDHLPPDFPSPWGSHPPGGDWNHSNAVAYDVENDRIAVSLRRQSRIVVVDWSTGETAFQFGDLFPNGDPWPCGDVTFGDNLFSAQHSPQWLPNGNMLVYDNGNFIEPLGTPRVSRAVEIAFDDPLAPTDAWIAWEYGIVGPDLTTPGYGSFVGDADRLANGNTLTNNGPGPHIMEADPAGNTVWHLTAGPAWPGPLGNPATSGTLVYRAEKFPDLILGTPGDADGDQDLDLRDLANLQLAYRNRDRLPFPERLADHDGSGALDPEDVEAFAYWLTGPVR